MIDDDFVAFLKHAFPSELFFLPFLIVYTNGVETWIHYIISVDNNEFCFWFDIIFHTLKMY